MIQFPDLPTFSAQATHVYWEPIAGSGERITAAVAMVDSKKNARVISLLSPDVLSVLYHGQASSAASIIATMTASLKSHLGTFGSLDGWVSPFSGFMVGGLRTFMGTGMEDIADQVAGLHSSMYKAKAPERPPSIATQSDKALRKQVKDAARRIGGLQADEIFTERGLVEVIDGGRKRYLDIPIKTGSKVGSIISAGFSTPHTVETHFLRAQSNLAVAAERGKYDVGLFVSRPDNLPEGESAILMDNRIDDLHWRLSRLGYHLEIAPQPEDLAREILAWAS